MARILFHIGVAKSGTTSLQNGLFDRIEGVANLGRPNHLTPAYRRFHRAMTRGESYALEDETREFRELVAAQNARVVVISDETLRTGVFSLLAERLHRFFPDAEIMITLRNQRDAIESYYVSHGRDSAPVGGKPTYVGWSDFLRDALARKDEGYIRQLDYAELVKVYDRTFGRDRVHVLLFEEMKSRRNAFLDKLAELLEAPSESLHRIWTGQKAANRGDSARLLAYQRFRSLLPAGSIRRLLMLPPSTSEAVKRFLRSGRRATVRMTDAERAQIAALFANGNRALEQDRRLTLDEWGYPGFVEAA